MNPYGYYGRGGGMRPPFGPPPGGPQPFNGLPPNYGPMRGMNRPLRSPFEIPKLKSPIGSVRKAGLLGKVSKLNLQGFIDTSSKAVSTFSQMIPIYREIKPVFSGTKTLAGTFRRAFVKPKAAVRTENPVVEPEVLDGAAVKAKKAPPPEPPLTADEGPHRPFF